MFYGRRGRNTITIIGGCWTSWKLESIFITLNRTDVNQILSQLVCSTKLGKLPPNATDNADGIKVFETVLHRSIIMMHPGQKMNVALLICTTSQKTKTEFPE